MTGKDFFNRVANGKSDVIQLFLDTLSRLNVDYCVIGGLAVNAYAEPVVSLDLDIVIAADNVEKVCAAVTDIFKVERFPHSVNLASDRSDLRIQLQTDSRYQDFLGGATVHQVLGYDLKVAAVEQVLQGKLWAYQDEERRPSKRQKDLADILRLVETNPVLKEKLPPKVREFLN